MTAPTEPTNELEDAFDIVRRYFPSATDEEMDGLLWTCSPFPFGSAQSLHYNLHDMACRASSPADAIRHAHSEYERIWCEMGGSENWRDERETAHV